MEAVPADAVPLGHVDVERVGRRGRWQGGVERRVEDRDVRHVGELLPRPTDRGECRLVVERGDGRQLVDRSLDLVGDRDGLDEPLAAVDDTVADGVGVDELFDAYGLAAVDDVELEPGRTGVDGQDAHRRQPGSSGASVPAGTLPASSQVQSRTSGMSSPTSRV